MTIAEGVRQRGLRRYWVAAENNFEDTWVSNFAMFEDEFGGGEALTGQEVQQLIPKPRIYLAAIYWALTTVRALAARLLPREQRKAEADVAWLSRF